MGSAYEEGDGVEQNCVEAARWYRMAAEQGDAISQDSLGQLYYDGRGVEQNYAEAAQWFQKAADQNEPFALYHLGLMYYYGDAVEEDYTKALQLFLKSTEPILIDGEEHQVYVGNVVNRIAFMYSHGQGTSLYYAEAAKWYQITADHDQESMFQLAHLYDDGKGVEQDSEKAMNLYRNAAELGHVNAQFNMGCILLDKEKYSEAKKWFLMAAEQGDIEAEYNLGYIYEKGYGVDVNLEEACRWYKLAADQGDEDAAEALKGIQTNLNRQ